MTIRLRSSKESASLNSNESNTDMNELYKEEDGVLLVSESNHYYSDLDRERMEQLIQHAKSVGWKEALIQNFKDNEFLIKIISDETRADWQYLLPLNSNSCALDIGAGWGTISIPIARNIDHVVALDGTLDRLKFLSVRAQQEGLDNLTIIHADIFQHPFYAGQFDLVSFNGVLEWVGVQSEQDPQQRQLEALKIAYDLLKPGGYLYIGIENAAGLKYVLGEPDDHTGIKYISYLQREEANELSLHKNKAPYSTYTYSMTGYQRLLNDAGYSNIEFYYPQPDYKRIESIYNMNEINVANYMAERARYSRHSDAMSERVNDLEKLLLEELGNINPFPASYSIVARKENN